MPDDDQDGAADGDDGLLLAPSPGDPSVALAQEGVGPGGADGGLAQDPGQVGVALAGGVLALLPAGGLADDRERTWPRRPGAPAVGNRVMSTPTSATITCAAAGPTPGTVSSRAAACQRKGRSAASIRASTRGDVGLEGVDPGQHPGQQERVVVIEPADERLLAARDLDPHPGTGQVGQHHRVALAGDQCGHHRPAGDPEDVAGHHRHLDPGVLQQLLHPVLLPGPLGDQVDPVAGQVPQPSDRRGRHETRPEHAAFGDLAQPHRVDPVGLRPARQVLHVLGVDQPDLEPGRLQQVERRTPVIGRRLHHHPGHPEPSQPVGQRLQRPGHRRVRAHLLRPTARTGGTGDPHAAHHLGLADIQRGDPLHHLPVVTGVFQHHDHLPAALIDELPQPGHPGEPQGQMRS